MESITDHVLSLTLSSNGASGPNGTARAAITAAGGRFRP